MTFRFCRYELRTTDDHAAREFYAKLLGHERAVVWPLHEQARARGAMPHWLGSIGVDDLEQLERLRDELAKRGATVLGPPYPTQDGRYATVLRDPGGAIVGLTTRPATDFVPTVEVTWQVLNTSDFNAAIVNYQTLFGWNIADRPLLGSPVALREFWWGDAQGNSAGAIADIDGRPGVHTHWLFFLKVESVETAVELTRQSGGTATDPINAPSGERISICEDPQRAAFGVIEQRVSSD